MKKIVDMDEWNKFYIEQTKDTDSYNPYEAGYFDAIDSADDWFGGQPNAREEMHGKWELLDDCSNAGVYCSICHKKVYRKDYANQKMKSPYCPNCGTKMDLGEDEALLDVNLLKKTKQQFLNENNIPESAAVWLDVFCEIFKKNIDEEK